MTETPEVLFAHDFIIVFKCLSDELCQEIIEKFDADPNKWKGKTVDRHGNQDVESKIKSSFDLVIEDNGPWQTIFQQIHPKIQSLMRYYIASSPVLREFQLQATGYKIQMYPQGEGFFDWHADSLTIRARNRVFAMILYLNDVEKGGETEFYHQKIKVSPKAGNLLLFPVGWNYMHRGNVPESSGKYIISSFCQVQDD